MDPDPDPHHLDADPKHWFFQYEILCSERNKQIFAAMQIIFRQILYREKEKKNLYLHPEDTLEVAHGRLRRHFLDERILAQLGERRHVVSKKLKIT